VEEFARRLEEGPPAARVTRLERRAASEEEPLAGFEVRS
jgi:acylphosphatase